MTVESLLPRQWHVPGLWCRDCPWPVWTDSAPTYWVRGTTHLLCLWCVLAHSPGARWRFHPLHAAYEDWVDGSGALIDWENRQLLLRAVGAWTGRLKTTEAEAA